MARGTTWGAGRAAYTLKFVANCLGSCDRDDDTEIDLHFVSYRLFSNFLLYYHEILSS